MLFSVPVLKQAPMASLCPILSHPCLPPHRHREQPALALALSGHPNLLIDVCPRGPASVGVKTNVRSHLPANFGIRVYRWMRSSPTACAATPRKAKGLPAGDCALAANVGAPEKRPI